MADLKFQLIHPQGKPAPRIDQWKYDLLRAALLKVIPQDEQGIPFTGLELRVAEALSHDDLTRIGALGWFMTHVKLDMEARGELTCLPGSKPQRLRRITGAG